MGLYWGTVLVGLACTCIGLGFGCSLYRGRVEQLKMEIQVLKRELSDEKARSEAYGEVADEWRILAYRCRDGRMGPPV